MDRSHHTWPGRDDRTRAGSLYGCSASPDDDGPRRTADEGGSGGVARPPGSDDARPSEEAAERRDVLDAADLAGYAFEPLWRDGELNLSRSVPRPGRRSLLAVSTERDPPTAETVAQLEHAWALRSLLAPRWAARPCALVEHHGRPTLVLEDPGGVPLARLVGRPWAVTPFLRVAIGAARALGGLHARGLVHKDVKPANLLVEVASGEAWLLGFGLASLLPRERQAPGPPKTIAGTLAYMAPEQTGRMNRSIDSRSDLYALGATLYEMVTGELPFSAADPLEWVHCHIARRPVAPAARAAMPEAISPIIMKLLAKTAEERYQTAAGLEADLRRCLTEWEAHGQVGSFALGEHDASDRLLIPETLYGREAEIDALLAAFARVVADGTPELVLVSGYSGIGKSSVVNELHKSLVEPRGLFAAGKFDQYKRDIPYATLAQAFQELIRQILAAGEAEAEQWRQAIREAVGPNGQLVVNLIPELEFLIGAQPEVAELPPRDAQSRFQLVLRRFIAVFARAEHPLALFLDDLQWMDAATLALLESLVAEPEVRHLLLVGAYRDNEVGPAHPLAQTLETLRGGAVRLHEIVLRPLALADIERLVGDALHAPGARSAALAELVHEKTGGNPFFAIQFISALCEEDLLVFDPATSAWTWDLARIRAKKLTDNVVDLMAAKLTRLPAATQRALQDLACLGHVAAVATLSLVHGRRAEEVHAALWDAVRSGLVLRFEDVYAFVHDRVHEAAYALIPQTERATRHLRIGRVLAERTPEAALEESIFEIVNQLDRGVALITDPAERERVAELNLLAGRRARLATAYASALTYLDAGRSLLADDCWERQYALAYALEFHLAECCFLTGDFACAEERLTILSQRAATLVERAAVAWLHMSLSTTLDRSDRAVEICLDYLRLVGVDWSPHPTSDEVHAEYERMWRQLGERPIEELIDLPVMTDPVARATLDVLTAVQPPALFTDENLLRLVVGRMANLSLEYGNSDGSCVAYVHLSTVLGSRFGDYGAAARFGQLGVDLVETPGFDRFRARVYLSFANVVSPWMSPVRVGLGWLRRAFDTAQETGDLTFASYARNTTVTFQLIAGTPLDEVQREAEGARTYVQQARFGLVADMLVGPLALIRTLRGVTPGFGSFDDGELDAAAFEEHLDTPPLAVVKCRYHIRKLQACYFAGDFAGALDAAAQAEQLLWTSLSFFEAAEYHFYAALSRAAEDDAASPPERARRLAALAAHHQQLAVWAESCPANFAGRAALVAAEIARLDGREVDAERLYEDAIRAAHEQGFVHDEAIANESAARFQTARGFATIADAYLGKARACYARWGAHAKVRQLEQLHPQLHEATAPLPPTSTIGAPVANLDLATVLRASQAVSSEIVLDKLIDTLLVTALEHAGASRGVLLLAHGEQLRIEAEARTVGRDVAVEIGAAEVTAERLPESVLRYVGRTRASVLLDDARAAGAFASDPYFAQRRVRSLLSLPLIKQSELIGVLQLENELAPNVFTPARIEVLQLLASQAAVSLENARLYDDVRQAERTVRRAEQELRLAIDSVPGLVWTALPNGLIDSVNQRWAEFLGVDSPADAVFGWPIAIHPDDLTAAFEHWTVQLASGEPCEHELRMRRHDGEYRWLMVRAVPLRDEGGAIVRWYGATTDIHDRKRAEQLVQQEERELRQLVDFMPQKIGVLGTDGRFLHANRTLLAYIDRQLDEVIQSADSRATMYHPDDLPRVHEAVRALTQDTPTEVEARMRRYDGVYRWHMIRYEPLRDEDGHITRWYASATDIEERKVAEERMQEENLALREEVDKASMFEEIVGVSAPLRAVLASVSKVAPTESTVLITGETGTGKELVARAIHKRSRRASRAFVSVNCAAIPAALISSELFGHEKGAFTGALQRRLGRFELADGGTIFLDEIGDLPPDTQLTLLRVLQEREFERVGGSRPIKIDVRVITATNRDLELAMADGSFRSDLFYRLDVFPIALPSLRERVKDIPLLVAYFVERYANKAGKTIRQVDRLTLEMLQSYHWPGNIRELQNVIERSVIVCDGDTLTVDESWLSRGARAPHVPAPSLNEEMVSRERQMIEAALAESRGRVSGPRGAAAKLGIPASTLDSKIRVLKINKARFKAA